MEAVSEKEIYPSKKNIILFIYVKNDLYDKMLELQRSYVNSHPNFKSYFITYDPEQAEDVKLVGDILYIKGDESILNITHKTLESFRYILDSESEFDFIIRSNMSTVINLFKLDEFLNSIPNQNIYCGGNILCLHLIDHYCGILDDRYFGTHYVHGTSMILSEDSVEFCVKNKDLFDCGVVDDVSFGVFFKNKLSKTYENLFKYNAFFESYSHPNKNACFFRHKKANREEDIIDMKNNIEFLYS